MNKLGIIVPYRNRKNTPKSFVQPSIKNHFKKSKIDYEIDYSRTI